MRFDYKNYVTRGQNILLKEIAFKDDDFNIRDINDVRDFLYETLGVTKPEGSKFFNFKGYTLGEKLKSLKDIIFGSLQGKQRRVIKKSIDLYVEKVAKTPIRRGQFKTPEEIVQAYNSYTEELLAGNIYYNENDVQSWILQTRMAEFEADGRDTEELIKQYKKNVNIGGKSGGQDKDYDPDELTTLQEVKAVIEKAVDFIIGIINPKRQSDEELNDIISRGMGTDDENLPIILPSSGTYTRQEYNKIVQKQKEYEDQLNDKDFYRETIVPQHYDDSHKAEILRIVANERQTAWPDMYDKNEFKDFAKDLSPEFVAANRDLIIKSSMGEKTELWNKLGELYEAKFLAAYEPYIQQGIFLKPVFGKDRSNITSDTVSVDVGFNVEKLKHDYWEYTRHMLDKYGWDPNKWPNTPHKVINVIPDPSSTADILDRKIQFEDPAQDPGVFGDLDDLEKDNLPSHIKKVSSDDDTDAADDSDDSDAAVDDVLENKKIPSIKLTDLI